MSKQRKLLPDILPGATSRSQAGFGPGKVDFMEQLFDQVYSFAALYGLDVIGALLILILGRFASGIGRRVVQKLLTRAKVDPAVTSFVGSLTFALILTFSVLAALSRFGVQTASFIAVLGAAGFAVGFALQGSLANFAAGVLLLVLRPFKVGDYIDAGGVAGTVKEIQLFTTTLATPDNVKILSPNGALFSGTIRNYSAYDTRRVDMVIGVGYDAPLDKTRDLLTRVVTADERVLKDPAPVVAVSELADSSVNFIVRPWVAATDYWAVKFDLTQRIKDELDAAGIDIPFPQRVVHVVPAEGDQA